MKKLLFIIMIIICATFVNAQTKYISAIGRNLSLGGGNDEIFIDTENGFVGINTSTPSVAFNVIGAMNVSGAFNASSFCISGDCRGTWAAVADGTGGWTTGTRIIYNSSDMAVGIGTSSPESSLHIVNSSGDAKIIIEAAADQNSVLSFENDGNIVSATIEASENDDIFLFNASTMNEIVFEKDNVGEVFRVDGAGEFGIGTPSPASLLHVNGSGHLLNVSNAGTPILYVNGTTSRVGIGTQSPLAYLDVNDVSESSTLGVKHSGTYTNVMTVQDSSGENMFQVSGSPTGGNSLIQMGDISGVSNSMIFSLNEQTSRYTFAAGNISMHEGRGLTLDSDGDGFSYLFSDSSNLKGFGSNELVVGINNAFNILESETNTHVATFTTTGRLGIGISAPNTRLDVQGSGDLMNISTGTSSLLFVNGTSGRLGVGTTKPLDMFEVRNGNISVYNDASQMAGYEINAEATGVNWYIKADDTNAGDLHIGENDGTHIFVGGNGGNPGLVGIGTTVPDEELHINETQNAATSLHIENQNAVDLSGMAHVRIEASTADAYLVSHGAGRSGTSRYGITVADYFEILHQNGNGMLIGTGTGSNPIIFGTNNAEVMRLASGGNVGIGTTTPASLLHLNGTGNFLNISNATQSYFSINDSYGKAGVGTFDFAKGNTYWYYQETANSSYEFVNESGGTWADTQYFGDGSWDSNFAYKSDLDYSPGFANVFFNYTKPYDAIGGRMQMMAQDTDIVVTINNTISASCWTAYDDLVAFRVLIYRAADNYDYSRLSCWNGASWATMRTYDEGGADASDDYEIYEEAMWWSRNPVPNVGIGAVNPTYNLHVNGSASLSNSLYVTDVGDVGIATADPGYQLDVNGSASLSNSLYVTASGDVGIGDSTPTGKLQVTGDEVRLGSGGTVNSATGDGDLYIQDDLEVDGLPSSSQTAVHVDANGLFYRFSSSQRYKTNITDLAFNHSALENLRPVFFDWDTNSGTPGKSDFGLIAEEVYEIFPRLVSLDEDLLPESVSYAKLSVLLLDAYSEQEDRLDALEEENTLLKTAVCQINSSHGFC